MNKPLIGITTFREINQRGTYNSLNYDYVKSVLNAGGVPLLIPLVDEKSASEYIDKIDGILFSGGEDVAPFYYNENPTRQLGGIDYNRDRLELKLFNLALEKKLPIFGICRGLQLINVACNGTLYQDIDSQVDKVLGHHPNNVARNEFYHNVKIKENTKLKEIFNKELIFTNSFHHQSIKKIGDNLIVNALSEDGIIEGVEAKNLEEQFILAVQWHPENLCENYPEFLNLFKLFVEKAKKYGDNK